MRVRPANSTCGFPLHMLQILLISLGLFGVVSSSPPSAPGPGMLLRVRKADGSMERILIPPGKENTISLQEALAGMLTNEEDGEEIEDPIIRIGSTTVQDDSQSIATLGLKRGDLISIANRNTSKGKPKSAQQSPTKATGKKRWDPFPDLAKDFESAVIKSKARRSVQSGMSYGALADIQSSLHLIEPQPEGPLKRVYMCANSAQRFQSNCFKKAKNEFECRIGLLLGTVQKERVELKRSKSRTSLSSQTESSQYCNAAKVHALWEPPTQEPSKKKYDGKSLIDHCDEKEKDPEFQRVLRIADLLGLRPIGWIFAYNDKRHKEEESLPVYGPDAKTGSLLQISNMKRMGREDGSRFVTLSMDATTGATEAFQLSDVCVQMFAEDLWDMDTKAPTNTKGSHRFVMTKHAVLVDGKELKELDTVLCLVNTAMLSHAGSFAGPTSNSVKKSGGLTNKVKKVIVSSLDSDDDGKLLEALCDFNLLLALDKTLSSEDMEQLCGLVKKYARGQKRGTHLDERLKLLLRSMLDS